jgi:hypothetical protein
VALSMLMIGLRPESDEKAAEDCGPIIARGTNDSRFQASDEMLDRPAVPRRTTDRGPQDSGLADSMGTPLASSPIVTYLLDDPCHRYGRPFPRFEGEGEIRPP